MNAAKSAKCLGNMRNYGNALLLYVGDNGGLLPWNGKSYNPNAVDPADSADNPPESYRQLFEEFVRPYLHKTFRNRLRCPLMKLGPERYIGLGNYSYNYAGNSALSWFYPKFKGIPVPSSQVVLASEFADYNHFYWPAPLNQIMWGSYDGPEAPDSNYANLQYHGSTKKRGLHMFFLDGHSELVFPSNGNWRDTPGSTTYGSPQNPSGLFYEYQQFQKMRNGIWQF